MILAPGGSGVGLFISKATIDASRGKIWLESQKDKGSTFCFSPPISQNRIYAADQNLNY